MKEPADFEEGDALCDFLELYLDDHEAGQVRPLSFYLTRFPGQETAIAAEFLRLRAADRSSAGNSASQEGRAPLRTVGVYEVLEAVGRGGQGTVYRAFDPRFRREVALKVLEGASGGFSLSRVARLRREAEALSKLNHPNLAAVYDADFEAIPPWIAMRFVAGETLAERLEQARLLQSKEGLSPEAARERILGGREAVFMIFERAARALAVAHEAGVIHRDIKPGNLMIDANGDPVIVDFGLARATEGDVSTLTMTMEVIGTLAYMAPEQVRGNVGVDHRADVYSLGATLFETLTLRRLHEAPTHAAMIESIMGDASSLHDARKSLGLEISAVLETALEREPSRRYATAHHFAEDLKRVISGEIPSARPTPLHRRLWRVLARYPRTVISMLGLVLALGVGFVVTFMMLSRLRHEHARLGALRDAHVARRIAERHPTDGLRLCVDAVNKERHPEIVETLYELLDQCHERRAVQISATFQGPSFELSKDSKRFFISAQGGRVAVVDLSQDGEPRWLEDGQYQAEEFGVASFSPDGAYILSGFPSGRVKLHRSDTLELLRSIEAHGLSGAPAPVRSVHWSKDGRFAVSSGEDGFVSWCDLSNPDSSLRRIRAHDGAAFTATFDDDAGRILSASGWLLQQGAPGDDRICVIDASSCQILGRFGVPGRPIRDARWSSDGRFFLYADDGGLVHVHDAQSLSEIAVLKHQGRVYWADFVPKADEVATGSQEGIVVFDLKTITRSKVISTFSGRSVISGAFSPDGTRLAVVSWDETAAVFDVAGWREHRRFRGHSSRPRFVSWSADGETLATTEEASMVHLWFVEGRPFMPELSGHQGAILRASFLGDDDRALSVGVDGVVALWDLKRNRLIDRSSSVDRVAAAEIEERTGRTLIVGAGGKLHHLSVLGVGKLGPVRTIAEGVRGAWWIPGDSHILVVHEDGSLLVQDPDSGRALKRLGPLGASVLSLSFSEDGRTVAIGTDDRRVMLFDLQEGTQLWASKPWEVGIRSIDPLDDVSSVVLEPKGKVLYASCEDGNVRVFSALDGRVLTETRMATPGQMLLDPDGRFLLVASKWYGNITMLDLKLPQGGQTRIIHRHANLVNSLALDRKGRFVFSASKDGTMLLWDVSREAPHAHLKFPGAAVVVGTFSPSGQVLLVGSSDGRIRTYPLDPVAVAVSYEPYRRRLAGAGGERR